MSTFTQKCKFLKLFVFSFTCVYTSLSNRSLNFLVLSQKISLTLYGSESLGPLICCPNIPYPYNIYNHGQKSLGQSERNFNSMRFTSSVAKSNAVFLKIHVPSPLTPPNTMLKDQRNCALTVLTLSVGWG